MHRNAYLLLDSRAVSIVSLKLTQGQALGLSVPASEEVQEQNWSWELYYWISGDTQAGWCGPWCSCNTESLWLFQKHLLLASCVSKDTILYQKALSGPPSSWVVTNLKCPYVHESYLGLKTLSFLVWKSFIFSHLPWAHSLSPGLTTLLQVLDSALWDISLLTLVRVTIWGTGKLSLLHRFALSSEDYFGFGLLLCMGLAGFCNSTQARETLNMF